MVNFSFENTLCKKSATVSQSYDNWIILFELNDGDIVQATLIINIDILPLNV